MENNWKELKIDNLPSDILIGDYEFEYQTGNTWNKSDIQNKRTLILKKIEEHHWVYRYRKPEPTPPTHEEIMTKWWLIDDIWNRVEKTTYSCDLKKQRYLIKGFWAYKEYFTNRESAVIPPEGGEG